MENVKQLRTVRPEKKQNNSRVFVIVMFTVLAIYTISFLLPLLWGLMTSFKTRSDFMENTFGLPRKWLFSNYSEAFSRFKVRVNTGAGIKEVLLGEMLLNSGLYISGALIVTTFVPCITAYLCASYKFKFNKLIHMLVIIEMLVPIVGAMPSMLRLMRLLHLYDNVVGLWIQKANFCGMSFLVFYGTFKGLSRGYAEAAFIDGASHTRVMFTIMIPLVKTIIGVYALMHFISLWNDYQVPMVYLPSMPTAAYGLFIYSRSSFNSSIPDQLTGCMILMIPTLLAFLLFHKKMIGNLTVGGLKG